MPAPSSPFSLNGRVAVAVLLALAGAAPRASAADPSPVSPAVSAPTATSASLAGNWLVDLRPSPDAPAYDKPMALAIAADGTITGTFYDSEIVGGRASASNGRVCFAFQTTDGAGPYQTSGCLVGGRILGQTWAEHRQFALNWSAVRR
jgi:hypothetical protein